jgi:hypothetical protein
VKNGVGKSGIGRMVVIFPIRTGGINFDIAMEKAGVDLDRGMAEVWASAMIPLPELCDA